MNFETIVLIILTALPLAGLLMCCYPYTEKQSRKRHNKLSKKYPLKLTCYQQLVKDYGRDIADEVAAQIDINGL
jgi:hypothetical protein